MNIFVHQNYYMIFCRVCNVISHITLAHGVMKVRDMKFTPVKIKMHCFQLLYSSDWYKTISYCLSDSWLFLYVCQMWETLFVEPFAKYDRFSFGHSSVKVLRCARDMLPPKAKSHTEFITTVRNIHACVAFPGFFYLRSMLTYWKFITSMIILLIFKICIYGFFVKSCFSSILCVWCVSLYVYLCATYVPGAHWD